MNATVNVDWTPSNARHLKTLNTRAAFVMSSLFNGVLIALLATERNPTLRAYSNVMMLNCGCDLVFALLSVIVNLQTDNIDGSIIAIFGGEYSDWSLELQCLACWVWLSGLMVCELYVPLVFYFRYSLVVKRVQISSIRLLLIFLLPLTLSTAIGSMMALAFYTEKRDTPCEKLLTHPIWTHNGAVNRYCIYSSMSNTFMTIRIAMTDITSLIIYPMMITFAWRIIKVLRTAKLSEKTAKIHRQMNILLAIELLLPVICAGLPLTLDDIQTMTNTTIHGSGLLIISIMEWIPLINPLVTILFVTNYRRRTARRLRKWLCWPANNRIVELTTIGSQATRSREN